MRKHYLGFSAAALTFLSSAPAMANCEIRNLRLVGDTAQVRYDPFELDETPTTVRIQADLTKDCAGGLFELAILPDPAAQGPGGSLLARQGAETIAVNLASGNRDVPVSALRSRAFDTDRGPSQRVESSGSITLDGYGVYAPRGQVVSPGRYLARAQLIARVRKGGDVFESQDADFRINVSVAPSYRLAAGVSDRVLALGELAPGVESGPSSFSAYANVGYELVFVSENGWRLMREGEDRSNRTGVPYTLRASGVDVERATNRSRLNFANPPADGRRRHELTAIVNSYDRAAAGRYSDVITVEIRPRS